ncbi:hypothetical protein Tco_0835955 [Tanacetum coccineum]
MISMMLRLVFPPRRGVTMGLLKSSLQSQICDAILNLLRGGSIAVGGNGDTYDSDGGDDDDANDGDDGGGDGDGDLPLLQGSATISSTIAASMDNEGVKGARIVFLSVRIISGPLGCNLYGRRSGIRPPG